MNNKSITYIVLTIVSIIITCLIFINSTHIEFGVISSIIGIIFLILSIMEINNNKTPEAKYKSTLKQIMNSYDAILVKTEDYPDFIKKEVITTENIEDLINMQEEVKKPVFYKEKEKSTSFYIIDNNVICVYILKENEKIKDPIEDKMLEDKVKGIYKHFDESVLSDIDNTTIIKIENKSFRVSPIRKKDGIEMPKKKK